LIYSIQNSPEKIVWAQNKKRKAQEEMHLNYLPILIKIVTATQIYRKDANIKFYENASSGSPVVTDRQ
jgi:hypothetical protein